LHIKYCNQHSLAGDYSDKVSLMSFTACEEQILMRQQTKTKLTYCQIKTMERQSSRPTVSTLYKGCSAD